MGALSPTHWLIIVGVLVVLFGSQRLPGAARSLGRSARILKFEVKDMKDDPSSPESAEQPVAALPLVEPVTVHLASAAPVTSAARADVVRERDV